MDENLLPATRKIIKTVEGMSGCRVELKADPSAQPCNALLADGARDFHTIGYNPWFPRKPDYPVAFQCGLLMRRFALEPGETKSFSARDAGLAEVRRMISRERPEVQDGQIDELQRQINDRWASTIFTSTMDKLHTLPVRMRVEDWLRRDYYELMMLQREVVFMELKDLVHLFRFEQDIPAVLLDAQKAMNGAYALYWAEATRNPSIFEPYENHASSPASRLLVELWHEIPADPSCDCRLVDAWAEFLHLGKWYEWVPEV